MNVKLDTKEKFTVITPQETEIPANMTDEMQVMLLSYLEKPIPHVIVNMKNVAGIDDQAAAMIAGLHSKFSEHNASFIVCELQKGIAGKLEDLDLLDIMNVTPTESEAWDIVQMEEIERELMKDFDNNSPD